ncbi:VanZ family protein [Flavobacterium sp.]|uniref:VanZ family protein n=1 Tax=Flavobacterium sp. TaxID=239 RepID=UPI0039E4636E
MPTKNLLAHKHFWLTLAIVWTLVIAVLCLVSFKKLPTVKLTGADKYVHAVFHLVFTGLWFLYLRFQNGRALAKAFFASVAYGILIEIMQGLFTQTRKADLKDVLANITGALLAVMVILAYEKLRKRKAYN